MPQVGPWIATALDQGLPHLVPQVAELPVGHALAGLADPPPQLGDPVHLEFIRAKIGEPGAFYKVVWRDQPIAMASGQFGLELMRVLKASTSWKYPRRIEEVSIDAIRTVGGDSAVTDQEGLGPGGAWLVPSLIGIGRFIWEDKQ